MIESSLRWTARVTAVAVLAVLTMGVDRCPGDIGLALKNRYLPHIEAELGFAVYVQPGTFSRGTRFAADVPGLGATPPRVWSCHNRCKLVMLDLDPSAHFSHPVVIATFDLVTGALDPEFAQWWPFDLDSGTRYFHTEKERRTKSVLCSDDDCATFFPTPRPRFALIPRHTPGPLFATPPPAPPASTVWAVVVNGYDSPEDTFDEDTDGMVQVLSALAVPDWRVCYLSDGASVLGDDVVDSGATIDNLQRTMDYLAALLDNDPGTDPPQEGDLLCGARPPGASIACSELVFFISTHGFPGTLSCNHFKESGGPINDDVLAEWLDGIACDHKTVVIEACKSGSFMDDLEGDTRSVFVTAAPDNNSYKDRDPYCAPGDTTCDPSDPQQHDPNPGDSGSEVVWGFLEAFGTAAADLEGDNGVKDGRISFAEAVTYAIANDASPSKPSAKPGATTPWFAFHGAFEPETTTLSIADGPSTGGFTLDDGGLEIATIKRCSVNTFTLKVENTGARHLAAGTLRMHASGPSSNPATASDHALTQLIPGLAPIATASYELRWCADTDLTAGDELTFVFSLDSPQSPGVDHPVHQIKQVKAKVVEPSTSLFPCGCRTVCGG